MEKTKFDDFIRGLSYYSKGDMKLLKDYEKKEVVKAPVLVIQRKYEESNIQADYYAEKREDVACFVLHQNDSVANLLNDKIPKDRKSANRFLLNLQSDFIGRRLTNINVGKSTITKLSDNVEVSFQENGEKCFVIPEAMNRVKKYFN